MFVQLILTENIVRKWSKQVVGCSNAYEGKA